MHQTLTFPCAQVHIPEGFEINQKGISKVTITFRLTLQGTQGGHNMMTEATKCNWGME